MRPSDNLEMFLLNKVRQIRRVRYELAGRVLSWNGPLEVTFEDGRSVVLKPAPDGERLSVTNGPWADPFSPPLSAENAEYIRTHGKWTAYEVSDEAPFSHLVGRRAQLVVPVLNSSGVPIGVEAIFASGNVRVEVVGDELIVDAVSAAPNNPNT